jgi:hypothetical protein
VTCLDFDDTVCGQDGQPIPGAKAAVQQLRAWGYRVIVPSARFSPLYGELNKFRIQKVQNWFDDFHIEIDEIRYPVPTAQLSIDDLGWRFPADWQTLEAEFLAQWPHGLNDKCISVALDCVIGPDGAATGAATDAAATIERQARLAPSL